MNVIQKNENRSAFLSSIFIHLNDMILNFDS